MPLLAERLRPSLCTLSHLAGPAATTWHKELAQWRDRQKFHIVFWGPPGSGKTTLARMLAEWSRLPTVALSAVQDGVKEIREAAEKSRGGVVFIDEIHRLSRNQQDVLLPILEESKVWILGATTENPSVTLSRPLLSRLRTIHVAPPSAGDLEQLLERSLLMLEAETNLSPSSEKITRMRSLIREKIVPMAAGDVRFALNTLEALFLASEEEDEEQILGNCLRAFTTTQHYDWASAMIKSLRGSDPDAALFYAMMAIDSGDDPLFILRRCVIFASEDVGNADPQALGVAVNALRAFEAVGMPEGAIPIAQCVTYLAATVKSNRSYKALHRVREWREKALQKPPGRIHPPVELTRSGRENYKYPHDYPDAFVFFDYLPDNIAELRKISGPAYLPSEAGAEARIAARLRALWNKSKV